MLEKSKNLKFLLTYKNLEINKQLENLETAATLTQW